MSGYKTSALPSPQSGAPAARRQRGAKKKGQNSDLSKLNFSSALASFLNLAVLTGPFLLYLEVLILPQNDW